MIDWSTLAMRLRCESTTPFGWPVVPDENGMAHGSVAESMVGAPAAPSSSSAVAKHASSSMKLTLLTPTPLSAAAAITTSRSEDDEMTADARAPDCWAASSAAVYAGLEAVTTPPSSVAAKNATTSCSQLGRCTLSTEPLANPVRASAREADPTR